MRILEPFLNFKIKCTIRYSHISTIGNNAGYITKDSTILPSSNKTKLLCNPQPKQFISSVAFVGHCIRCDFKKEIISFILKSFSIYGASIVKGYILIFLKIQKRIMITASIIGVLGWYR